MKDLLLLAASGLAREILADLGDAYRPVGILDDDSTRHGGRLAGIPILGGIDRAVLHGADLLVCVGSGQGRRRLVERLAGLGVGDDRYATFVSSAAHVPTGNRVGVGSIVLAGVVLTANVSVGRHVVVMPNVTLTHDNVVDDFVTIAAGVSLGGAVVLREASYIGMNASVRQGVEVGRGATVGMGAVVLQNVPAGETWLNVPARPISRRPTPDSPVDSPRAVGSGAWS
ncbi:NeuD/PglB/VioB family sugar acetyltransferase [Cryobacterium sp. HLT2-28]|uniref:NeuD/PglB/VioB family sugar acetyltransferase n=1 Tax=Cryobacterium sp. HLT2-28 TaxID=1259146 RepID=UPI00106C6F61|nr:NeuD/PglB/VioB family sugar acetyltransferase [Cryobacterium sp. HLT2-28]TFB91720.1 acetyltransferase [Cryobacterium sp. HLT2-28]